MTTIRTDLASCGGIADLTIANGGATVSVTTMTTPLHGYAVALPDHGRVLFIGEDAGGDLAESLPRVIAEYVDDHRAALAPTGHYVGTWLPGDGFIHLDVVEVVHDLGDALQRAADRDEVAVFDLEMQMDIPVDVPAYL